MPQQQGKGNMSHTILGTGGRDTLVGSGLTGPGVHTINGLNGDNSLVAAEGAIVFVIGEGGFDTISVIGPRGTISGGDGNDEIRWTGPTGPVLLLGNFGSDTIDVPSFTEATIVGERPQRWSRLSFGWRWLRPHFRKRRQRYDF